MLVSVMCRASAACDRSLDGQGMPPVALPPFALNQHWHPRFHHDPAIVWLRELMKRTFDKYPEIDLE